MVYLTLFLYLNPDIFYPDIFWPRYFNGQQLAVDKAGYLLNVEDWQAELAPILAATENIQLTDNHDCIFLFNP